MLKEKILELCTLTAMALGIIVGQADSSEASPEYYSGENYGGDISHPPEGSVINIELSEQAGYPIAVDVINNTQYAFVISHWFDPQQIAQFPSDVLMYGVSPYDHSSGSE